MAYSLDDDNALIRYSRHIMLPQLGIEGQEKLQQAKVAVFGLGGLGSPVALYLAAAGVGELVLIDFDQVDLSNLQRQIIHTSSDIGLDKVESAANKIKEINPLITITTVNNKPELDQLSTIVSSVNVVVDGTDNFVSRFAINKLCVEQKKPLISGAAIRMEGQISTFRNDLDTAPCYRCLYSDQEELDEGCTTTGVLAPVVGIIGSIQALETIKVLTNIGATLTGKLMLFDGVSMEWRTMKLKKDPNCPVCS